MLRRTKLAAALEALIAALETVRLPHVKWARCFISIWSSSTTGLYREEDVTPGHIKPEGAFYVVGVLSHRREKGPCTKSLYHFPCKRPTKLAAQIMAFIAQAYRNERSVTFTLGDPIRYKDCWVCWYGDLGFIVQCNIKGGHMFIPWDACPTNIAYKE